jgi:hypothetical protein
MNGHPGVWAQSQGQPWPWLGGTIHSLELVFSLYTCPQGVELLACLPQTFQRSALGNTVFHPLLGNSVSLLLKVQP